MIGEVRPDGHCVVTRSTGDQSSERPVDRLLASLAVSFGPRVLAVILADTEADGVRGGQALRGVGGTVVVHALDAGNPTHWPRMLLAAGAADLAQPLEDLGQTVSHLLTGRLEAPATHTGPHAADILEKMGDAHCVLDREFVIRSVNAAAERLLGTPRTQLLGRSHWEAFPASVDAPVGQVLRRTIQEGTEEHLTHHYTGEGHDLYLELDTYPTSAGGVALFWRDISERMYAEATLPASEEQQAFLLTLSDALRPLGDTSRIQQTASRLLGEHLGVSRTLCAEVHDGGEDAEGVVRGQHVREGVPFPELFPYQAMAEGFTDEEMRAGGRVVVSDVAADARLSGTVRQNWLAGNIGALVAVPLVKDGQLVAIFGVHHA